jgi:hypothetical protein
VKDSERKWNERKRNLHPLVTMETGSHSRKLSNKNNLLRLRMKRSEDEAHGRSPSS